MTPVGVPLALSAYMLLPQPSPIFSFDLNFIFPGATTGPLTLTDTTTGVNLAWGVRTTATDLRDDSTACFIGTYSSQINGMTAAALLTLLESGGSITSTYSASFNPVRRPSRPPPSCCLPGWPACSGRWPADAIHNICRQPVGLTPT